ncbi:MAG: GntR family transcriptional regulator [Gammaproteobacteria bacterium]
MTKPRKKNGIAAGVRREKRSAAPDGARSAMPVMRRAAAAPASAAEVYERIWSAIMDHSLPPETRLVEERLCEIFGLGRTRLRQVLQRLAHERVVTLMPNRGAIVSRPTIREAREVFAARRVLEAGIVQMFLEGATRMDLKRIQDHLASERAAWVANDRRAMLKLSGEFHLVMAEVAGNSILIELLRDLISRSSLIIAVYQVPGTPPCPPNEHQDIVGALEKREPRAVDLMLKHLDHLLADLRLEDSGARTIDLRSVFAGPSDEHAA